jgi:TonB family protein
VKVDALEAIKRVPPVYPVEAKRDRITGSVILAAIIGKDGTVENLKVTKSLRPDCDKSALDAVQQWVYKPFLLNGNPIEVKTSITVKFSLAK